ncbi:hypothetical protein VP1G_10983 [Cytospora mali]|uniref:Uncharacterized protein n=1 Tax=Cytospora mali TaxID=578113 RepID=A0A194UZE8_CYTMA|nr:hypothetical protein VP1G_10983 [Valsa mali var. pyri (nom. inval.)]
MPAPYLPSQAAQLSLIWLGKQEPNLPSGSAHESFIPTAAADVDQSAVSTVQEKVAMAIVGDFLLFPASCAFFLVTFISKSFKIPPAQCLALRENISSSMGRSVHADCSWESGRDNAYWSTAFAKLNQPQQP